MHRHVNVPALVSLLAFTIPAICVAQSNEQRAEEQQKAIEERVKDEAARNRANMAKIETKRFSMHSHTLDEMYRLKSEAFSAVQLETDRGDYQFLSDVSVIKEMGIPKSIGQELVDRSRRLKDQWPKVYRSFLSSGDLHLIDEFEKEFLEYESWVEKTLNEKQIKILTAIKARNGSFDNQLINIQFPLETVFYRLANEKKLPRAKIDACVDEIRMEAKKIKDEGNWLLIQKVNDLLPGYLEHVSKEEAARMGVIPLAHMIAIVENPTWCENHAKKYFSDPENYKVTEGKWLFSTPIFGFNSSGKIYVQFPAMGNWQPRSPVRILSAQIGGDLAGSQKKEFEEFMRRRFAFENASAEQIAQQGSNRTAQHVAEEKSIIQWIGEFLIPEQRRTIANYVRVHSLFVFGPAAMKDQIEKEKRNWKSENFDENLADLLASLKKHVKESQDRIQKIILDHFEEELSADDLHVLFSPFVQNHELWLNALVQ
jgi:hypothetical protein